MITKKLNSLENSYKNPFSEFNANVMDSESILDYWCSPFRHMKFGFNEEELFSDKNTTLFLGGRGSGKTMLFKYSSYPTQWKKAISDESIGVLDYFKSIGGAGHYIRIDGPILRSFSGFGVDKEVWSSIFAHYFELTIAKSYIEFIQKLVKAELIETLAIENLFLPKISSLITGDKSELSSLELVIEKIEVFLDQVTQYRGMIPIAPVEFNCERVFLSQKLSGGIPQIANETIEEFEGKFRFVLFIDEFENYLEEQQQIINTLLRFNKPEVIFRIGMRLEGYKTFATINPEEFIKEGRDYKKVVFEDYLIKDGYRKYLLEIAEKRLSSVVALKEAGLTNIKEILGASEVLEEEALQVAPDTQRDKIFKFFKISGIKNQKLLASENPLLQTLNCIWFNRGETPEHINKSMSSYLDGKKDSLAKKYHSDYVNKYKYSLTIILCVIYRRRKSYYSFNTLAYLSSGIVGHFIETCRRAFQLAEFENFSTLLKEGKISHEIQSKAARDHAESELQQIRRIETHGTQLYYLVQNLGNIFSRFHRDPKVRFPEMNQFSIEIGSLSQESLDSLIASQKWSLIQRKSNIQKVAPGKGKSDLYTLNRVFSPLFEISYRTRGGINVDFNSEEFELMMHKLDQVIPRKLSAQKKMKATIVKKKKDSSSGDQAKLNFGDE